ncbi:MAG TPA: S9 family peptidase [Woeseiaceae bacterium]|nr:S9 family peptidase [Woeseiaceae bacterium]
MKALIPALAFASLTMVTACSSPDNEAPRAAKVAKELEIHGDVRVDNYYWLKERDNPDVIAYLEAENEYTDRIMGGHADFEARLVEEMKARIPQDDQSAPVRHGDHFYYRRFEADKEYPIYCRRKGSMDGEEEILLDVNVAAEGHAFYSVRGFKISPDHKRFGYGVDTIGRRFYDIHFVDIETGEAVGEPISSVTPFFEWGADSRSAYYVKQDPQTLRWFQVYRHTLGDSDDELVYEEADETFFTSAYKSISGKFLYIYSESTIASEVRYLALDDPDAGLELFLARRDDHEYQVQDGGDRFYIRSNDGAKNFRILEAPLYDTSQDKWQVVVAHRDDVLVEDFTVFQGHVVIDGKRQGLDQVEVLDRVTDELHAVEFEEEDYRASTWVNLDYDSTTLRYFYESMTTPDSSYDYDLVERTHTLVKEAAVLGDFDRNDYVTERRFATARDGTKVPVSLVYRKGTEMDGQAPLIQYGYGSYGNSIEPNFSRNRLSLLDRGFIFAIAHIRGGSEMGRDWYFDGRQLNKLNTFYDFIDVSKFLISEGYTSPEHLYARGGSAGGLLMGAVMNMAPKLYNGITTRVPFVDVITTMLDPSIPLTTNEYDEWGNPNDKEFYDYILSYSPYDQIQAQDYPNTLVTTGLHDSQVQYWEPAKWVAKMRDMKTDDNILVLKTDMQAGHSGKTGRFQSLEDDALYFAFFMSLEGISE